MPREKRKPDRSRTDEDWIRWWCYHHRDTCSGLAKLLDVDKSSVSRWKRGSRVMGDDIRARFRALLRVREDRYAKGPNNGK